MACKAGDAVQALELPGKSVDFPRVFRVGNGPVFAPRDLDLRACQLGGVLNFIRACTPIGNAFAGSLPDFTPLDADFDQSRSKRTSRFASTSVADLLNST
ncbi:MAG TPA: hypothetical protein PLF78_00275 [Caulobacter sp.]|nr:hypothetical protein [Caulobacter sp.]